MNSFQKHLWAAGLASARMQFGSSSEGRSSPGGNTHGLKEVALEGRAL